MAIIKNLPDGASVIDLGAARVARAEAKEAKSYIKLAAGFIQVKTEIPLEVAFAFEEGRILDGLASMLADPADADSLIKDGLTAEDLEVIIGHVSGKSLGESEASQQS
jgi:hypothetical protein